MPRKIGRLLSFGLAVVVLLTHHNIHTRLTAVHDNNERPTSHVAMLQTSTPSPPPSPSPFPSPFPVRVELSSASKPPSQIAARRATVVKPFAAASLASISSDLQVLPSVDVDVATCARASSCIACLKIKAHKPPLADTGVRCVWCRAQNACQGFIKGTAFPCADAVRGGGGYPGGSRCAGPSGRSAGPRCP